MDYIKFDYVTGVLFVYIMGAACLLSASCFIALFALRRADNKRRDGELLEVKTKIKAVEQLWLDSNGRKKIK